TPNATSLLISCRPFEQPPTFWKSPVTRSTRVHWFGPIDCQLVSGPAQSSTTSENVPFSPGLRTTTSSVSEYVGSVKSTYESRYCSVGVTLTHSGSPSPPKSSPPVMYWAR